MSLYLQTAVIKYKEIIRFYEFQILNYAKSNERVNRVNNNLSYRNLKRTMFFAQ